MIYEKFYTLLYKLKYTLTFKFNRKKYAWNCVYNTVMTIKDEYNKKHKDNNLNFDDWLSDSKYSSLFEPLSVSQTDEFILIRYGLEALKTGLWKDKHSIYRECRSIIIDLQNESIVICPFRKFFNLNQVEETKEQYVMKKIKKCKVFEVSNKIDGSMQSARLYNGKIILSGSRSMNPEMSWRLKEGYSMLTDNHIKMIKENPNLTFIFECVNLKDSHVVIYDKQDENLYLIGIRDVYTGKQLYYKDIFEFAKKYNVPVVEQEIKTIEQLLSEMSKYNSHEKEGWVVNIDGLLVKIKCDNYSSVHAILDSMGSVNIVLRSIANNTYDDLISKLPEIHRYKIEKLSLKIFKYMEETEKKVDEMFAKSPKNSIQEFMTWVDKNCDKDIRGYVKCKYLNKEYNVLKFGRRYKRLKDIGLLPEDYDDMGI